jgi:hypothetical protein
MAGVNEDGDTVLHLYLACLTRPPPESETISLLVQARCSLNVLNKQGRAVAHRENSPLVIAEIVDFFEGLGVDLSLLDSEGRPPLHYVVCCEDVTL